MKRIEFAAFKTYIWVLYVFINVCYKVSFFFSDIDKSIFEIVSCPIDISQIISIAATKLLFCYRFTFIEPKTISSM